MPCFYPGQPSPKRRFPGIYFFRTMVRRTRFVEDGQNGRMNGSRTHARHRRHRQARRRESSQRLRGEGWQVLAAGSRDGDLSGADAARALVERAVAELGGLDVVVNAASAGFEPKRFEDVTEADVDAALGATVKGASSSPRRPHHTCAPPAASSSWSRTSRRTSRGPRSRRTARRRRRRRCSPACSRARSRPRCASAASRRDRSRSSPTRRSGVPPRLCSAAIGSPDDVAGAILYLAGADFVTGTTIVVDGGRLLQSGRAS